MYTHRRARGVIKVRTVLLLLVTISILNNVFHFAGWVLLHNQSLLQERQISKTLAVCVAVCSKVRDGYADSLFFFFCEIVFIVF